MRDRVSCMNMDSIFRYNSASLYGGVIYMRYQAICINTDSIYVDNLGSKGGGAIYIRYDIELINTASKFINNTAEQGGSINIGYQATSLTTRCLFQNNFASKAGGAMVLWYGVNFTTFDSNFTQNRGKHVNHPFQITRHARYIMTELEFMVVVPFFKLIQLIHTSCVLLMEPFVHDLNGLIGPI